MRFRQLDGLKPTVESCTMKVLEEVGELMQLLGKGQGLSGEDAVVDRIWAIRTIEEALDVAQAAVTMVHALSKEYGVNLDLMMVLHNQRLKEKGYLK